MLAGKKIKKERDIEIATRQGIGIIRAGCGSKTSAKENF